MSGSKWTERFLELSEFVAGWSKDPSTKVGAVIAEGKRIVSIGFNGPPAGTHDSDILPRDEKLRRTIHAETNAILFARRDLTGCTIYVSRPPCSQCAAKIIQAGIKVVVARSAPKDFVERWQDDLTTASNMFYEAGVTAYLEC
jgi:dCMP deaminase